MRKSLIFPSVRIMFMANSPEINQFPDFSPFQFAIHNPKVFGERRPHISTVPVHDIQELLSSLSQFQIAYAGYGSLGIVFRVSNSGIGVDSTIKVIRDEGVFAVLQKLYEASKVVRSRKEIIEECVASFFTMGLTDPYIATTHQVKGHILGNQIAPTYIDTPTAIWINPFHQGHSQYVGYSLPFIQGEAINISEDEELVKAADEIESTRKVYLGNRKSDQNASRNAIVNQETGVKKFIDVKLRKII